ncbi:MAG: AMP-binding protein [Bacteroidaceae bacterium]|nr:AMP-binding protein [Bacteroidaceae bacterium]
MVKSYVTLFEKSVKTHWSENALTDYPSGASYTYSELACQIEKIHILFERDGIVPGDKVAICGRNWANWAVAFLATVTYGAVAVPILHKFTAEQVQNIVNHSETKLFFVGESIIETLNIEAMPNVSTFISLVNFEPSHTKNESLNDIYTKLDSLFLEKYSSFSPNSVQYYHFNPNGEDLFIINYTSGSTGKSKGVMIPNRAIWSNIKFYIDEIGTIIAPGNVVSILPMAHMYGLAFEVLAPLALGMHTFFLTRNPSPSIIFKAFAELKPTFIVSVPLVVEKIMQKTVIPQLEGLKMKLLLKLPLISQSIKKKINDKISAAFGGNFFEIIIGGAALNKDVESLLRLVNVKFTVGYGATECAPLITYVHYNKTKKGSCGVKVPRMEIKINSSDPTSIVGEILCKGDNVMLGYYKNEEETRKVFDSDGWLHTGDLGTIDKDGYLYISGRSKNMLLGPSGQNIYPEELEDRLNSVPLIAESVVIQSKKDNKLYGLIYLDADEYNTMGLSAETLPQTLDEIRKAVNKELPDYAQISGFKIYEQEFEKTPKQSIKRFLYFDEEV